MRFREIVNEAYSLEKARIDHPEDLVLTQGSKGAKTAIKALRDTIKTPKGISVKADGAPALIWGNDKDGFAFGDKYMFNANELARSPNHLLEIYSRRKSGGKELLANKLSNLWPLFEESAINLNGFVMGDLMYSQPLKEENGVYSFKPVTVEYSVAANSELGKKIAKSYAGVIAHSFFPAMGAPGGHIDHLENLRLNTDGALLIMSDQLAELPKLKEPHELKQVEVEVNKDGKLIDKFLDKNQLKDKKISDLSALFMKYVNHRVRHGSFGDLTNGFIKWLPVAGLSKQKQDNIMAYLKEHNHAFNALFMVFAGLMAAKDAIVHTIETSTAVSKMPIQAKINGVAGHEGYLVHTPLGPIKMINRLKFSNAHFNH